MKSKVLKFFFIFFVAVICSVVVAICGGVEFGTPPFGWLVAFGMVIGSVVAGICTDIE